MKIEKFPLYKWFLLSDSKTPADVLIAVIKKRIDEFNDFEFNGNYTKFRRIEKFELPRHDMTYSFSWKKQSIESSTIDGYDPDKKLKSWEKKDFDRAMGRK